MAMTDTPLIIAGGRGGIDSAKSTHAGCDASTNTTGYRSWSGGINGHGAQTASAYSIASGKNIFQ